MPQYSGVFTLPQQAQALTSGQWCTDPYFKNTALLLHADGIPGGAQNNTFLDSSSNAFTITRNGNTTQGTFSPYMPNGYWSNYFDGTGDYLSVASNAALALPADFTWEAWVYPNNVSGQKALYSTATSGGLYIYIDGASVVVRIYAVSTLITAGTLSANMWNHVAVTRNGTTIVLYVNGVSVGTATSSQSFAQATTYIGTESGSSVYHEGYISNLRVVKGTAVYTSNFTPSTAPLTAISGTSLLTCQSNRFLDNSTNAFTVTPAGNVAVQQFQPFMRPYQYSTSVIGGSGYFDGTGDYLDSPSNAALTATGDFTFECWVYITNSSTQYQGFFSTRPLGTSTGIALTKADTNFEGWVNGSVIGTTPIIYNAWVHLAIARSGSGSNNIAFWVNGVRIGTLTNTSSTSTSTATIGRYYYDTANYYFGGYLSGARMVNGTAVYNPSSSTITIPTAPLTAVSNTSLLCNMTNAGIYDNAMQNNLETVGNAQVSTSVVKYGSGSMYFVSGAYVKGGQNNAMAFGTGAFTTELWIYPTTQDATNRNIVDNRTGENANAFTILINNGYPTVWTSSAVLTSTTIAPLNTWTHVAVVGNGAPDGSRNVKMYINGSLAGTWTTNYNFTVFNLNIADYYSGPSIYDFLGYIDDLRITKGVARYTSNFQPPQVAFANQ